MATGKVLQFDPTRGYGFVSADDGGDDIFLHASVFDGDPSELIPGLDLQFQVMAGDRGRKAYAARFVDDKSLPLEQTAPAPQPFPATEEDQMCDVLSQSEFGAEVTELLLNAVPALSGQQILAVRQTMLEFARKRGWVDA